MILQPKEKSEEKTLFAALCSLHSCILWLSNKAIVNKAFEALLIHPYPPFSLLSWCKEQSKGVAFVAFFTLNLIIYFSKRNNNISGNNARCKSDHVATLKKTLF